MTITLELSPEEEARLRVQARQQGQEVEAVARAFVRVGLAAASPAATAARYDCRQHLLEQGDISYILQGRPGPPPRLVPIQGESLSETIVREQG